MKNRSETKICRNKKCQKVLPPEYPYEYCEACRNKQAHQTKNVIKIVGSAAAAVVGTVLLLFFVRNTDNENCDTILL